MISVEGMSKEENIDIRFKRRHRKGEAIRVVEITFVPGTDAEQRLHRALDLLLGKFLHEEAKSEEGMDTTSEQGPP